MVTPSDDDDADDSCNGDKDAAIVNDNDGACISNDEEYIYIVSDHKGYAIINDIKDNEIPQVMMIKIML